MEEIVRAIARPAISVIFAIVIAVLVVYGIEPPEWFLAVAIPILSWWFLERTISHARAANTTSIDKLAEKVAAAIKAKE